MIAKQRSNLPTIPPRTTKKLRRAIVITAIVSTIGMTSLAPSKAHACECLPVTYAATISTSELAIGAGFTMLTYLIMNSFSALNAALSALASATLEAATYTAQSMANTERQILVAQNQKKATNTVDNCVPKAATIRAATIAANADAFKKAATISTFNWARGMEPSTSGSDGKNAIITLQKRVKLYCDDLDESLGLCTAVGEPLTPSADAGTAQKFNPRGADIRADTLFGADSHPQERTDAVVALIKNIHGLPAPIPGKNDLNNAAGVSKMVDRNTDTARGSVASTTLSSIAGLRAELKDPEMKKWLEAILKSISGNSDPKKAGVNPDTDGISMQELMKVSAEYRFKDSGWLDQVMAMTGEATPLFKQIALMEATMLHHDWKSFEMEQLIAANIASSLAARADANYNHDN
jgi:hypothetical protein